MEGEKRQVFSKEKRNENTEGEAEIKKGKNRKWDRGARRGDIFWRKERSKLQKRIVWERSRDCFENRVDV